MERRLFIARRRWKATPTKDFYTASPVNLVNSPKVQACRRMAGTDLVDLRLNRPFACFTSFHAAARRRASLAYKFPLA